MVFRATPIVELGWAFEPKAEYRFAQISHILIVAPLAFLSQYPQFLPATQLATHR